MYRDGGFDIGDAPIGVPTLFITGDRDGCLMLALSDRQEKLFSGKYERQIWPEVGHFPHIERAELSAAAVLAWFNDSARRPASHRTATQENGSES